MNETIKIKIPSGVYSQEITDMDNKNEVSWSSDFSTFFKEDIIVYHDSSNYPACEVERFKIGTIKNISGDEVTIENFSSDQLETYRKENIMMSLLTKYPRFLKASVNAMNASLGNNTVLGSITHPDKIDLG